MENKLEFIIPFLILGALFLPKILKGMPIENVNEFLTITPNVKEIEQGKDGVAKVTIANFGQDPITVNVETTTKDKKIKWVQKIQL